MLFRTASNCNLSTVQDTLPMALYVIVLPDKVERVGMHAHTAHGLTKAGNLPQQNGK